MNLCPSRHHQHKPRETAAKLNAHDFTLHARGRSQLCADDSVPASTGAYEKKKGGDSYFVLLGGEIGRRVSGETGSGAESCLREERCSPGVGEDMSEEKGLQDSPLAWLWGLWEGCQGPTGSTRASCNFKTQWSALGLSVAVPTPQASSA